MDMNSLGKRAILAVRHHAHVLVRSMARPQHKAARKTSAAVPRDSLPHRLRIIGGQWRGRPLTVPPLPAVRPSPDRVRETLFNWLQSVIPGARCLDLFAGSGALGFEALSRGAAEVVFVDSEPQIGTHLRDTLGTLQATNAAVHVMDALQFLRGPVRPFDVVFLDPPFASKLLPQICEALARNAWLAHEAFVYLECPADAPVPALPPGWLVHRSKQAGQVGYHLLRVTAAAR
jgi:16S rRNA (guanine966-N2)-methyltransferase